MKEDGAVLNTSIDLAMTSGIVCSRRRRKIESPDVQYLRTETVTATTTTEEYLDRSFGIGRPGLTRHGGDGKLYRE